MQGDQRLNTRSRVIASLEEDLGVSLFHRTRRIALPNQSIGNP
jgi:hypothetical protein